MAQFAKLPVAVLLHPKLSATAIRIYALLVHLDFGHTGQIRISFDRIGEHVQRSRQRVRVAVGELLEAGFMTSSTAIGKCPLYVLTRIGNDTGTGIKNDTGTGNDTGIENDTPPVSETIPPGYQKRYPSRIGNDTGPNLELLESNSRTIPRNGSTGTKTNTPHPSGADPNDEFAQALRDVTRGAR